MSDTWFSAGPAGHDDAPAGWLARPRDENAMPGGSMSLLRRRLAEALERTRRAEAQTAAAMAELRRYKRRLEAATAQR